MLGAIIYLCKLFVKLLAILFLFAVLVFAFVSFRIPKSDRNWSEEAKILPDITISTSTIEVKRLRDFRYDADGVIANQYYDESFDLEKIDKAYFLINQFGFNELIGHTFFIFTFTDGKAVSISVEARREVGVPYSSIKGLLNNYELWYIWGSPADFMSRRAVLFNDDLAIYPLQISTTSAKSLILDLAETTEELETKPRFYNTVLENCTNVLADSANRVKEGSVPWNIGRVITGFADDELYKLGFIPHDKSFEEIYKEARIDREIRDILESDPKMNREEFWDKISR